MNLSDGVIDVSSPEYSLLDGTEIIIKQDDISCRLGYFGSHNSHSKSDISLLEGRGIIGSITSDSNDFTQFT